MIHLSNFQWRTAARRSCCALAVATFLTAAHAADDAAPHDLGEEVIKEEAVEKPKAADVSIDAIEIQQKQAADLSEVFRGQADIDVGGGGGQLQQKIYVRGLEDTNLNVSIDGAQQSGYLYHHQGRVSIDTDLLKSVDVETGTGNAAAGPGALGGAVRLTTKNPEDLLREGQRFGGIMKGSYGTNGDALKGSATLYGSFADELNVLFYGGLLDADSYDDGDGNEVPNSLIDQGTMFLKINGVVAGDHHYSFSHERTQDTGRRPQRPHMIILSNTLMDHESSRNTSTFNYGYKPGDDLIDLDFTAYYSEQDIYLGSPAPGFLPTDFGVETWGLGLSNTSIFGDHTVVYGTDLRYDRSTSSRRGNASIGGAWDGSVVGLYAQDAWQVNDRLLADFGLRLDHYEFEDDVATSNSSTGLSPNLSLTYKVTDAVSVHGGWARAHRGVRANEALFVGLYTYADDIDAETADTVELGFDYDDGALSFGAEVFRTEIQNFIELSGSKIDNVGDVSVDGYSAYVGYRWDNLSVRLGVAESRPELEDVPLSDVNFGIGSAAGRTWTFDVNYAVPSCNLVLGWESKFVEDLSDVPAGSKEKDGYHVHNAHATWLPTGKDDLTVTLGVYNIFNEQFYDHTTYGYNSRYDQLIGMAEPGIDGRLTVAWKF